MFLPITLLCAVAALPFAALLVFAFLWPQVTDRLGLFLSVGAPISLVIAASAFYWVILPLTRIGISAARPGDSSATLLDLLGLRFVVGGVVELGAAGMLLWALARYLERK